MEQPKLPYTQNYSQKPGLVQAVGIMTLVNGILNILWGIGVTIGLMAALVTICLVPLGLLPIILGIFEIIFAVKLLATPPQPVQPSQTIAILEICCILFGNVISLVVGILALVFYSDPAVKEYFAQINGQTIPAVAVAQVPSTTRSFEQAGSLRESSPVKKEAVEKPAPVRPKQNPKRSG